MKKIYSLFAIAGMVALFSCGGGSDAATTDVDTTADVDTTVEVVDVDTAAIVADVDTTVVDTAVVADVDTTVVAE